MQELTSAAGGPYPRPTFHAIRELKGKLLCDLKWESEDESSRVEYYDLCVVLTGAACLDPGCGGAVIVGMIPGKVAINGCCRCLDLAPAWVPQIPGAESFSSIAERLLRQAGLSVYESSKPTPPSRFSGRRKPRWRTKRPI